MSETNQITPGTGEPNPALLESVTKIVETSAASLEARIDHIDVMLDLLARQLGLEMKAYEVFSHEDDVIKLLDKSNDPGSGTFSKN